MADSKKLCPVCEKEVELSLFMDCVNMCKSCYGALCRKELNALNKGRRRR